jgi:hypothetical protein
MLYSLEKINLWRKYIFNIIRMIWRNNRMKRTDVITGERFIDSPIEDEMVEDSHFVRVFVIRSPKCIRG